MTLTGMELMLMIDSAINAAFLVEDLVKQIAARTGKPESEVRLMMDARRAAREADHAQWIRERDEYYAQNPPQ